MEKKDNVTTEETKATQHNNYSIDLSSYLDDVKVSRVTRFLWWCCGADPKILMKATNYDRVKYGGIGGIVLVCGVLATFAGGLAFQASFAKKEFAADKILNAPSNFDGITSRISKLFKKNEKEDSKNIQNQYLCKY